ncbi:MAG: alanyl-tRNA editing protein [Rhodovarius sp.]|nr:alanyl-tRNA editing protein [Rhodovarius sp.]MDW8315435.1 alanyl-tRNA editing protein [Rhodovarius sp.]
MTHPIFREDPYASVAEARVIAADPAGVVLEATPFYPQAGGQPGDTGVLEWPGGSMPVADTRKAPEGPGILHIPPPGAALPPVGALVTARLDWARRYRHMRMHTALHLLCSLIRGAGVTGGQIGELRSRLDFDLAQPPPREALEEELNALVAADLPVGENWITPEELDANPGLVRTLSVQPPRGAGMIRLVRIGPPEAPVDLQPCGGTHVRRTGEIGRLAVGKIENKGRQNRRVHLLLAEEG